MTLEDLKHIFRFQLTADENFTPTGKLEYTLFEGQNRLPGSCPADDIEKLVVLLDNFVFDGYRDRTPLFVKPEAEV